MNVVDKVIDALTPMESDADRLEARRTVRELARPNSWLAMVLDHHLAIDAAFAAVRDAASAPATAMAHKQLAVLLTAHSIAEEGVIYPALTALGERAHAEAAYLEQSNAKQEMAALEALEPMSQEYFAKLEEIRVAVAHHVYEEEGTWFLELQQKADAQTQHRLSQRYEEEFERYFREGVEPEVAEGSGYGGDEIGMREAGGYSGSLDQSQRGGRPVKGGAYGGLRDTVTGDGLPSSHK